MKKCFKPFALLLAAVLALLPLAGCTAQPKEAKLGIAIQYGMSYAPMVIVQEQGLIEKHYGAPVEIEWSTIGSGSAINEAVLAGEIDVACVGIAPFVTGVSVGIPYKLFTALSGQPMGLHVAGNSIQTLADFTPDDKIALVSYGSIQHIMLGMAAEAELGDAHALDNNILNMPHPDGMQALISGSVTAHLTTAPYYNMEKLDSAYREIESVQAAFPEGCTIIVAAAAQKLFDENRALYDALAAATAEAIAFINNNPAETAALLYEREGLTQQQMEEFLADAQCVYTTVPQGVLEIAAFMERAGFAENVPTTLEEIYFEDLLALAGGA